MSTPVLHGRHEAVRDLRAALAAARSGRGQLIVVTGEAGIGKSALATAFATEVEAQGVSVTWGRAWEFADAPPYFPLWPCLKSLGLDASARESSDRSDDERAFHLWEAVVSTVADVSSRAPLVWIVEDVHAADLGTLDLLTFLAQPLRALAALVVVTMRQHDPRLDERKLRRIARMTRDGREIRLEPLGEHDIGRIAEDTIGRAVSAAAIQSLRELTGGNPLFVVECARASGRSGSLDGAVAALPPTVRQVVLDRVSLLPDGARDALASGAVLGREFAAASIARMHESDPVRVVDVLSPAIRAGILRETKPGQFAFSHALVSDAVYESISEAERVRLHGRAAIALECLGDAADVLVERARHALASVSAGDAPGALAIAQRAIELLEREGAFDRALALYERVAEVRALGLLPHAPHGELLRRAHVAREAGRSDSMQKTCEEVIARARIAGDAEAFAQAALLHATDVRVAVIDPRQIALLREARALIGNDSPTLGCRVLARLATALQPADDPSVPTQIARDALLLARATGDERAIVDVLDLGGFGAYYAPVGERIAWAEELRDRALAIGDSKKALTGWTRLAYWQIERGDFSAFEHAVASALALADEIGHPRFRWQPLLLASGRAVCVGKLAESDRYLAEVTQIAGLIDDRALPLALTTHEILRARIKGARAEMEVALAKLDGLIDSVKRKEEFAASIRGACFAFIGDADRTRAALDTIDLASALQEYDAMSRALVGEAIALVGSDEERRTCRALLQEAASAELHGAGLSFTYEGPIERVIGLLDLALGDRAAGEAKLRSAHRRASERGNVLWARRIAYELGLEPASSIAERAAATETPPVRLDRSGDVWTIERGGRVARVKSSRGMMLLARLVERPGEEIHVLALASDEGTSAPESHAGEMLDDRAKSAYRARLSSLDQKLAAAEAAGDDATAERLEREKRALVKELARASGLGGKIRVAGSATERARINVQRRLKVAIGQVGEVDAELGRFFERAICTGTYCSFRPQ